MNTTVKPGRELDALVAEKVMGCKVYVEANGNPRCDCPGANATGPRPHASYGLYASLKRYSTDIAAAWEVVEKMREDGFLVALYRSAGAWIADTNPGYGKSDTAPHAICLAALRAVGEDV